MYRLGIGVVTIVLTCGISETHVLAQWVSVNPWGGVSVRAPFVRVDTGGPFGGASVRAPFTAVDTRGYWYGGAWNANPYPYGYSEPSTDVASLADMDWSQLRAALANAAQRLEARLDAMPAASDWKRLFQPGTIRDFVAGQTNEPPDPHSRQVLGEIQGVYRATAANVEYESITRLPEFQTVQRVLAEYVSPVETRTRRLLWLSAAELNQAVTRFDTWETWQRYFSPPPFLSDPNQPADEDALRNWAAKFERIDSTPEYSQIAGLSSFQRTRDRLAAYQDALALPPNDESKSSFEELPAPNAGIPAIEANR